MEKELNNSLDELVSYIINTKEYKNCIKYKEEMDNDVSIKKLILDIKKLQKKYVNTNDLGIKNELDLKYDELNNIDLYNKYNQNLEVVNEMINYVKEELNNYFDNLLNENTNNN